ncbi:MAG: glycosyltransferase family 4 protein, partial [candidate division NC10 bacterium]
MEIVFYAKGFPPREYGGPVVAGFHLLREFLLDRRVHITLITQTACKEEEIHRSLGRPGNLTVIRLPYYVSFHDIRTLRQVAGVIWGADLVHFNAFPFRHLLYLLLAKLGGIPTVYRLGGLLSAEAETTLGPAYPLRILVSRGRLSVRFPRWFIRFLLAVYRRSASLWNAVIANSEALKRQAVKAEGFDQSRIWVIPNAVELPKYLPAPPGSHGGPTRLLFVGKLEPVKGPDLLLASLGRLAKKHSVDLSIVGTGSLEGSLRNQAEELGQHNITFHGSLYREELTRLYAWTDIVVVPSRYESFPLVVLEAMAARRPLVVTAVGGVPEIV